MPKPRVIPLKRRSLIPVSATRRGSRGPGGMGGDGNDGWSAVLAVVADGERRVLQIAQWVGGEGTPPATADYYLGPLGLVQAIGDATNIRGATGGTGGGGGGSGFAYGAGAPDDGDGADGDFYLDTDTGSWYTKAAGTWGSPIYTVSGDADTLDGHDSTYFQVAADYTAADVLAKLLTVDGSGSGLDADLLDGHNTSFFQTALGYTPLDAADYTAADVLAKLLTVDGSGTGLDADLLDGHDTTFFVASSAYTAADVLTKLLTVDGSGSGLDADLLDGHSSAFFQTALGFTPEDVANKSTDGTFAANSDTLYPSQKAVKTYADALIAANDAMVFKGAIDCSANPNYPAADAGWTYRISVAGKIGGASGVVVQAGDIVICNADSTASGNQATVGAFWNVIQLNIDGALTTVDIGVTVQAYDAELAALAGLTSAADKLPYFTGGGTAAVTTFSVFARTFVDDADATAVQTTLGLLIGTNVQAFDAELAAIAGLTSAADRLPYFTGSGAAALAVFTAFGRSQADDVDAAAGRTTLGLGTAAILNWGTSGTVVPLMDGINTWSAANTFSLGTAGAAPITLVSTDAGAGAGPYLNVFRNSASPAVNDNIGGIFFYGNDSGANVTAYSGFYGKLVDPTDTSEDGEIHFQTVVAGTLADSVIIGQGFYTSGVTGGDKGAGTINATTLYQGGATLALTYQPLDAELTALAGLTSAADRLPYFTGSGTAALATFSAFARTFIDDADASTVRGTLGLGTAAIVNTGTSGPTLPFLDGTNTWSGVNSFGTGNIIPILLQYNEDGANIGPLLKLYRVSATPADADNIGAISFNGRDSGGNDTLYAYVYAQASAVTDGAESGQVRFYTPLAGAYADRIIIGAGLFTSGVTGGDKGAGTINAGTLYQGGATLALTYQPLDVELTAIAGLTSAADSLPYFTGSGTAALATFTAFGRSQVDDADAAAGRTTLGLGTAAVASTGTSGNTLPFLDGANTWSGLQTITQTGLNAPLTIISTDSGASAGPLFKIFRDSSSPLADDLIGGIDIQGRTSTAATVTYASIRGVIIDQTNGATRAQLRFSCGTATPLVLGEGIQAGFATGGDKGAGTINAATLYEAGTSIATKYLASSSYTAADVLSKLLTVDGSGSGLDADLLDGHDTAFFVAASAYTAADVLSKLLTVDGSGSGLDADLLDGKNIGTSGNTIPLLDGANTWSGTNIFAALADLLSSDAGATAGPILSLYRQSVSPAANDLIGKLGFDFLNASSGRKIGAALQGTILDAVNGTEDAILSVQTIVAGTIADRIIFGQGMYTAGASGGDKGTDTFNATSLYEAGALISSKYMAQSVKIGVVEAWAGVSANAPTGYLACNGQNVSRTTYAALFGVMSSSATITMTIASPCVVTWTGHILRSGDPIVFKNSGGALPTGIVAGTVYYVRSPITANTFTLSTTQTVPGGSSPGQLNTSGSQSGVHTGWYIPYGQGDGSTTFTIPDLRGMAIAGRHDSALVGNLPGSFVGSVNGNILGHRGGEEGHTPTLNEMFAHNHTFNSGATINIRGNVAGTTFTNAGAANAGFVNMDNSGGGAAHNTVQPTIILNYIIFAGV